VRAGIDYALNTAATSGWGQWYGAKAAGVSPFQGIQGAHPQAVQPPVQLSPEAQDFVNNNPQPGGYGRGISDPNAPTSGSMAPAPAQSYQPSLGSTLASWFTGSPEEGAAVGATARGQDQKSPLARFFNDLKDFGKDAPQAHSQLPMPSATNGDDLLKWMQNPNPFTDFMLKQRLQGHG
jgi:hypothetical protein